MNAMGNNTAEDSRSIGPDLLSYGRIIHGSYVDCHHEEGRSKEQERLLKCRVATEERLTRTPAARKVLPLVRGLAVESNETAVLALAVFRAVCTDGNQPSIASASEICSMGDMSRVIGIRQAAFRLVKRGVLRLTGGGPLPYNGLLVPAASTLTALFGGDGDPAFFDDAMVSRARERGTDEKPAAIPTVEALTHRISLHVVGLEWIVKQIATRLVMHLHRGEQIRRGCDLKGCQQEVLLLIGSSGSGKTYTATVAAEATGRAWSLTDCTTITAEGYSGNSADLPIRSLVQNTGGDIVKAENGSLLICDEIDKRRGTSDDGVDVTGRAVQQAFLSQIETKGRIQVGGRRGFDREYLVDGRRLGWFFCGAFSGLDGLLRKNGTPDPMGFTQTATPMRRGFRVFDALRDYGFIDEFLNRLTGVLWYPEMGISQLERIVVSKHGPLATHNMLLTGMGLRLSMSKGAVTLLAEFGRDTRTNARGMTLVVRHIATEAAGSGTKGTVRIGIHEMGRAIEAIAATGTNMECGK
jgi:ATP-dependent protease Clp ATPase subunit